MKNPLLDVAEDISEKPFQKLSFFEKIGLSSTLLISIVILMLSSVSFYLDIFIKSDYLYGLIDILVIILSLGAVYFLFNVFKRKVITDVLIDTAFQDGVYERLKPLIENIAQAHVDTNILLERVSGMDLKIQTILKEQYSKDISAPDIMKEPIAIGTSIKFTIKAIFLITVTMAAFMFLINFNIGGIIAYGVLLIYIMWWGFITNEYNLWKESSAWGAVFFPVLVIPVSVMLLSNLLNYNVMLAALYVALGLYAFAYYLWAIYVSTGSLPVIATKKEQPVASEFFALQQRGILKEFLDIVVSRLEQQLHKDGKSREIEYAWKK